jgi:uncharacterized protein YqjF (DUF2071 family)
MRWTNLLFAHWPLPAKEIAHLLPDGLILDTWQETAWIGVVPFRMEDVQLRGLPMFPGTHVFPEANVRTYVREPKSGHCGVYFFSLDASNPLAVIGARILFHLPYYLARMSIEPNNNSKKGNWRYRSERLFSLRPADLRVQYRGSGKLLPRSKPGTIEYFLTERYALFTRGRGHIIRCDIHHAPWPLEPAEAEFEVLTLADPAGIKLPPHKPLLHFSRVQDVLAWAPATLNESSSRAAIPGV